MVKCNENRKLTTNMTNTAVKVQSLTKTYNDGKIETRVLKGIDCEIQTGEFVAIMGKSGAGKSTFLYQLGLLDNPSSGDIWLEGVKVSDMSDAERQSFRLTELGYVFQDYALLPELSSLENVALPLLMKGESFKNSKIIAQTFLEKVGMKGKERNLPSELSGGQQQRVSIARAVAHSPKILFADEPTANLDSFSGNQVMQLFKDLNRDGQTIVMVTHEEEYGKIADRIINLADGLIVDGH
jgi:putative ABC transport system ATP-binding protein